VSFYFSLKSGHAVKNNRKSVPRIDELLTQGEFQEAVDLLNELTGGEGQSNEIRLGAFLHLGLLHYFLSDFEKAVACFQRALSIDGNSAYAHSSLGYILAACPETSFRDAELAIYHATRGCALKAWKDPSTLGVLAVANMCAGYYETARPLILSAIRMTDGQAARERLWQLLALVRDRIPYTADPRVDHAKMVEDLQDRTTRK
jgi:Flp pilus assembly protein TadD